MKKILPAGVFILLLVVPGACLSDEYTQHHQQATQAFSLHTSSNVKSKINDNEGDLQPAVQDTISKIMGGGGVSGYTQDIADHLFPGASNYTPPGNLPIPNTGGGGTGGGGGMPDLPF
jgi:hypothetical protein